MASYQLITLIGGLLNGRSVIIRSDAQAVLVGADSNGFMTVLYRGDACPDAGEYNAYYRAASEWDLSFYSSGRKLSMIGGEAVAFRLLESDK